MKKKLLAFLLVMVMLLSALPLTTLTASAESVVSRDDGVWLFPLPSGYYNYFSDWAGCNMSGSSGGCAFHSTGCNIPCGASHYTSNGCGHQGIDIGCYQQPVYAAASGNIVYASFVSGRGNTVIIEHKITNTSYSYYSIYQHLTNATVTSGSVTVGQQIAISGNTGGSYDYHLHFAIIRGESGLGYNCFKYDSYGSSARWLTGAGEVGMIVTNPKACNTNLDSANKHGGSVSYTFNKNEVTIGTHTHSYTQYVNNSSTHPHYGRYSCTCGGVTERTTEPHFLSTCPDCIKPSSVFSKDNSVYAVYDSTANWSEAKAFCESIGGHLAVIETEEENNFIFNNISGSKSYYFIGCSDAENEGVWKWINGAPFSYDCWGSSQPDNAGGLEHYGSITVAASSYWNDLPSYYNLSGFICEFEAEDFDYNNTVFSGGNKYEYYGYNVPWTVAKKLCEAKGGHLATITSEEENAAVSNVFDLNQTVLYWLGATDSEVDGTWKWVTGEEFSYNKWAANEPNGGTVENYLNIYSNGEWNDIPLASINLHGFICEYDNAGKFDVNYYIDGDLYNTENMIYGSTPPNPTPYREGYTFKGWYLDPECTQIWEYDGFSLTCDLYLYGKFINNADLRVKSVSIQSTPTKTVYTVGEALDTTGLSVRIEYSGGSEEVLSSGFNVQSDLSLTGSREVTVSYGGKSTVFFVSVENVWSEVLPEGADPDDYEIKTQYRSNTRETTSSTDSTLDGWLPDGSRPVYGDWSSNKTTTNAVSNSDTVTVVGSSVTYHWYHYCCNYYDGQYNVDSISYGSGSHYYHTYDTTNWLGTVYVGDKGGKTQYTGASCSANFNVWFDNGSTTTYTYRTRSKTVWYDYYRYVSSGDWQDEVIPEAENTQVETRTLYRLKHTHTFGEWQTVSPKGCLIDGSEIRYCSGCDVTETRIIPASHSLELLSNIEATCTTIGYDIMKCSVCGERVIQNEVGALGHDFVVDSTVAPTCLDEGYDIFVCARNGCNESHTGNYTRSLGHNCMVSETVDPTCTDQGYDIMICTRDNCGYEYNDNFVSALGHHHILSSTVEPTCEEKGYDLYVCDREGCESFYHDNYTDALGHSYSYVRTISATCIKDGYHIYTCTRCKSGKLEKIEHFGHYFLNNICIDCNVSQTDAPFDVNGDSFVNATDLAFLVRALCRSEEESRYDVNADGTINILDLVIMKRRMAGLT